MSKDYATFEQVVLPHLDTAYSVARYLLRDDQAAQDVVQDAFLRALRHFDGYRGDNARAWLLAIVRNCCATWRGRERAEADFVMFDEREHSGRQENTDPEVLVLRSSAAEAFHHALAALPEESREVIVLREIEGLSYQEIALTLGTPEGTVMSRLSRARRKLQALLRPEARDAI